MKNLFCAVLLFFSYQMLAQTNLIVIGYTSVWSDVQQRYVLVTNYGPNLPVISYPPTITAISRSAPTVVSDVVTGPKSLPLFILPLANDADNNGTNLVVAAVTTTNGLAYITNITQVYFTPASNYIGTATLAYTASDAWSSASTNISVTLTDRPPVAASIMFSGIKNTTITIPTTINDTDPDGDLVLLTAATTTNGTVSLSVSSNSVLYVPASNFTGTNNLSYSISDGYGGTASGTIQVLVVTTNYPPTAINDFVSGPKSVPLMLYPTTNDVDNNGLSLLISAVYPTNGTAILSSVVVSTNVLVVTGAGSAEVNQTFLAAPNYGPFIFTNGVNGDFFQYSGGLGEFIIANPGTLYANSTNLIGTYQTVNGDNPPPLVRWLTTTNTYTTNIVFTPASNYIGTATCGYKLTDLSGMYSNAIVFITLTDRPPVAVSFSVSVARNSTVTVSPLAYCSDPDGDTLSLSNTWATNCLAPLSGNSFSLTTGTNFTGTTGVGYDVYDGFGGYGTNVVTVLVTNIPPSAAVASYSGPKSVVLTLPVMLGCTDPGGTALTLVSAAGTNGTAAVSGTNVVFTPTANFIGTATFGYTISDAFLGTNSAVDSIILTDRPPVGATLSYGVVTNTVNTFNVLASCSDPDGDAMTLVNYSQTNCTGALIGNELVVAIGPTAGSASIGFTLSDGYGGTNYGLVNLTITNAPTFAALIPFMTSLTAPSGTITYSSALNTNAPNEAPWDAFSQYQWYAATNSGPQWLAYDFGLAHVVGFCSGYGTYYTPAGVITNNTLYLQYSADNSTWNTVENFQIPVSGTASGAITNSFTPVSARYWRWYGTNAPELTLAALQLYGY